MLNFYRNLFGNNQSKRFFSYLFVALGIQLFAISAYTQDNSPYSRYGIGDLHPNSNIFNRGMGGISVGFSEPRITGLSDPRVGKTYASINFANPASYSRFYALKEANSKKLQYGRMLLDVGMEFSTHTLQEINSPEKFTSSNAYFSYLQLGLPIKKDWGLTFGIRPVSAISYKIDRNERLFDPNTGVNIDSAKTQFAGNGGAYYINTGTGFAIGNLSLGVNVGYLFGDKDFTTRRIFISDSVIYSNSNHQTDANFGGIFFNSGIQYRIDLNKDGTRYLQLGAFGNLEQNLSTKSNIIRETFVTSADGDNVRLDSVQVQSNIRGDMIYPASFGGGFVFEQLPDVKRPGLLFGIDYITTNWDNYSFNGNKDSIHSNWIVKVGGQLRPSLKNTYKSLLAYRVGFFVGDDYVHIDNKKLPVWGVTGGISLPIANLKDASRRFRTQYSVVNVSAEYIKRGNNDNPIKENQFRISVGFTLSDLWFTKRKYD